MLPPMISYAQNFEDVLLRRALPEIERGFYIDIGAFHPVIDNVTQWFYAKGWTGINVEPNPRFQALLREHRPHDLNLAVAVSGRSGTLDLHLMDGLSTTVDDVAEHHTSSGRSAQGTVSVEALTLGDLFERHTDGRTVDFLKIDVEGAEAAILEAYPFTTVRPRILVIEATEPDSIALASTSWEDGLLRKGYQFCYFDGLNRYYVRDEDAWRKNLFDVPPNVFDHFRLPFTDRRVDYIACKRSVLDEIPEGGIQALIAERDGLVHLRAERDSLVTQLTAERVARRADLRAERAAFAVELDALVREMTEVADARLARITALEQENRRLQAEVDGLRDARDISVIQTARLQIKVDALYLSGSRAARQ
ncbi:FkbM family methyltransferase [Methylobacterium planeticum]|uniref:FkbM family methyltransferase n=1 Tax=Methylobacterium planeticum TaxID=2615211 RepID=A0A6N6MUJ7_9HYPH|nr:FkbM family methyltransferase [Methylobacterium planeticum]KAB1075340.1 FkbM family methyltransferase [Methylobacterium planeticum]